MSKMSPQQVFMVAQSCADFLSASRVLTASTLEEALADFESLPRPSGIKDVENSSEWCRFVKTLAQDVVRHMEEHGY